MRAKCKIAHIACNYLIGFEVGIRVVAVEVIFSPLY
jgi:hypothetical protein